MVQVKAGALELSLARLSVIANCVLATLGLDVIHFMNSAFETTHNGFED